MAEWMKELAERLSFERDEQELEEEQKAMLKFQYQTHISNYFVLRQEHRDLLSRLKESEQALIDLETRLKVQTHSDACCCGSCSWLPSGDYDGGRGRHYVG